MFDRIASRPTALLMILCAVQIALWTLAPALFHRAMPIDVIEGYMTGREWVLLTYKHPQLPAWVLEISRLVTGTAGWPAYLVSQLFIAATFILVFLLGRELLGPRRAICGTLLLTGIYYFSIPTPEFNHNIAQMPIWVAIILLVRKAALTRRLVWWLALAPCAALALYAKFSMLVIIGTGGLWLLIDRDARQSLASPAPWIALVIFLILAAPIIPALRALDYLPLHYAAAKAESGTRNPLSFLGTQLLDHIGLFAILAIAYLRRPLGAALADEPSPAPDALRFLIFFTAVPLIVFVVLGIVSGARPMWGAPLFSLSGLIAMALVPRIDAVAFRRIAVSAFVLLVVLPAGYAVFVVMQDRQDKPLRVYWPQSQIAKRFADIWRNTTHAPLRIVGGNEWPAGLIGSVNPDNPSLYVNLNPAFAPWITPARLAREGMLVVWTVNKPDMSAYGTALPDGTETFRWSSDPAKPPFTIHYAIVPPAGQ